jgi:hypothetical protein
MIFCSVQDAVNLLTLFKYLSFLRTLLLWKQVLTVLFFYLYYLYCLSIFQRTCCFRFKSGCKGKGFIFNYQTFSEVFFIFSFYSFLRLSMRKGKNVLKKNKGRFLCESDCKDKNFIYYTPKLFGSFFVLFFKRNLAFSLCQFCKAFFSWKAGAKVYPFGIQSKYIKLFFRSFFERIC